MATCKNLRRKAASQYLEEQYGIHRAPATLAKLAVIGGGPPFRRDGRIPLYSVDDLDEWATSRLGALMRSTSEIVPMRSTSEALSPRAKMTPRPQAVEEGEHRDHNALPNAGE
jgi:hypothetical protein